jgi:anti-sigma-K factor RskA
VAAAAVVLVVAGGLVVRQLQSGDTTNVVSPAVTQVFKAPDAHKAVVKTAQGEVAVATSQKLAEMAVDTDGLKPLGKSKVYQLWSIDDGKAVSVGVLDDPDKGAAMSMPKQGTQVAITIEPAGGSPSPTGEQVVRVDPRAV